ncbi:Alpha/Beta hydrolase protein [Aspergillus aurantiobrunneus]
MLFLNLLVMSAVVAAAARSPPELTVLTSSGPVQGIYNDSASTVRAFLGVPYAEPPTGDLRFAPPRPKSPSRIPINASTFSGPCPQAYQYDNQSIWSILPYEIWNPVQMTEDCLSVNIWASSGRNRREKATVMLFIHGGGFSEGAGSVGFYDGTNLVRDNEDVVVVTFNYRLNVFGFPNAPGLELTEQNVGLLDQRLAVEWVHENIANFGGDPDRILLFGQSAGAVSVDTYSYAYPDEPLVSALALQSGTISLIENTDQAHRNWNQLSTAVGCGSGTQSLPCMRQAPFEKIVGAVASGSYSFTPVADNRTFFSDYVTSARSRRQARLPTLGGINEREFSASLPLDQPSVNETQVISDVYNMFSCPLYEAIGLRLQQHIPTWRYVYHGNFTNLSPTPWLGAYHSAEIPMLFGTYNMTNLPPRPASNEIEVSKYLQGAWVAFAKDPHKGLYNYGWPQFSFDESTLVNLGVGDRPGAVLSSAGEWDRHCI